MGGQKRAVFAQQDGGKSEKKLHKREARLQERLIVAREALRRAQARLQRAQERVQRRGARVERLEQKLARLQQHNVPPLPEEELETVEATIQYTAALGPEEIQISGEDGARPVEIAQGDVSDVVGTAESSVAQRARLVAEATENAAREAIERVYGLMEQMETNGYGRHLAAEVAHLQAEADAAKQRAITARASLFANGDVAQEEGAQQEGENAWAEALEFAVVAESLRTEEFSPALLPEVNWQETAEARATGPIELSYAAEDADMAVEQIVEEEESVESIVSLIIADAAAAAAAEAEALAEASSARTREAQILARQADQAVKELRLALERDVLKGDEAEAALRDAEAQATHAHAALADAEAVEEQARIVAMNAEAEAEVAEGMALAANEQSTSEEHTMQHLHQRQVHAEIASDFPQDLDDKLSEASGSDDEDTLEVPIVRPEENRRA